MKVMGKKYKKKRRRKEKYGKKKKCNGNEYKGKEGTERNIEV